MALPLHLLTVGYCRHCERMTRSGGRWRSTVFPATVGLMLHPREGPILYDTGYAEHFHEATTPFPERLYRWATPVHLDEAQRLPNQLALHGVRLADIRWCLISHFHADHIAGLRDLPNARFICMRADYDAMRQCSRVGGLRQGMLPALLPPDFEQRVVFAESRPVRKPAGAWVPFGQGYDLFGDNSMVAVALPGHTPAQMGLYLRDQRNREVFLCADAAWSRHAWTEFDLPALPTRAVMHDWSAYERTLVHLRALSHAAPNLAILPSHCTESLAMYKETAGWT